MERKLHFVFIGFLFLWGCSEEEKLDVKLDTSEACTRTAGDGKYDLLGYGYDITGEYLGENSTRFKVLNVDSFVKNNKDRFDNPFLGIIEQKCSAGEDAQSFLNQIIIDSNFSGSVANISANKNVTNDKKIMGEFSGTFKLGFNSNTQYSYSSKYSFARAEILKKQRRYYLNTNIKTLSRYLSSAFVEDLDRYSADKIVEMYGTHVLTDIIVGGTYIAYYKSTIVEENSHEEKVNTVSAGVKFNLSKIGLDANGSWSKKEVKEANVKNSNWNCEVKSVGGSTSGTTVTLNSNQGPTYMINLGAWSQSVDDLHSSLVDVNWDGAYPIYELIEDSEKKAKLKKAVEEYIESKKKKMLPIVPFYQYWGKGEHYYTMEYAPTIWYGQYRYEYVAWYLLSEPQVNTIPLYVFYGAGEHYYGTGYAESLLNGRYKYEGIAGYIYDHQEQGTVPLYAYWGNSEHYYSTYLSSTAGNGEYKFDSFIGYVYPVN